MVTMAQSQALVALLGLSCLNRAQPTASGMPATPSAKLSTPPAAGPAPVWIRTNPGLQHLAPLQKVHHSWGIDVPYILNGSDPAFLSGLVHDYVRITGSCSIALVDANAEVVQSCVKICEAVAPARALAGVPPPKLALNWSPWCKGTQTPPQLDSRGHF